MTDPPVFDSYDCLRQVYRYDCLRQVMNACGTLGNARSAHNAAQPFITVNARSAHNLFI